MKIVHEMRERQAFEQPKNSSPIPIILGAVIAFGIGLLGVSGIVKTPMFMQQKQKALAVSVDSQAPAPVLTPVAATTGAAPAETKPSISVDTGGKRIGRAITAPLLRSCMPLAKFGISQNTGFTNADLYGILQQASQMTVIAAAAGVNTKASAGGAHFASMWGDVADCVYRQNGYVLCDPDNRALAVEATTTFVRQLGAANKAAAPDDDNSKSGVKRKHNRAYALQNANAIKTRMFDAIKTRASEGRLVASDFGFFAPTEITQLIRDTKVTSDACAASR